MKNKEINWSDYLGIRVHMNVEFLSFEEARKFVQNLKLKNEKEWQEYSKSNKRPENIPSHPKETYAKEFKNFGDWLGTGNVREKDFKSYEEAKNFVHGLHLKNNLEWRKYIDCSKPNDVPYDPEKRYKNKGWIDWADFLGNRTRTFKKNCLSQEDMIKFMRVKKIHSDDKWKKYVEINGLPDKLPLFIEGVYNIGWREISGRIFNLQETLDFCRRWANEFKTKNGKYPGQKEWNIWCNDNNRPINIPRNPQQIWKEEFKNFGDFFGTGVIANKNKKYRDFILARNFARLLNLKNESEWYDFCKNGDKPIDIPTVPRIVYKSEFISMPDWLGICRSSKNTIEPSLEKAKEIIAPFVKKYNLRYESDWRKFCKNNLRPISIPYSCNLYYKNKGWVSYRDFFGFKK